MVRRSKEDAMATRDSILDAAELLFAERGVSSTTLQHIATAAGVTRGAIYWHFEDKASLFNALMERAKMPLEAAMRILERSESDDPLGDLREYALCVFRLTTEDARMRRAFEISTLKLEYVDEMHAIRERRKLNMKNWSHLAGRLILLGIEQGQIRANADPAAVALGVWVLVEGLIRNWMIEPFFDLPAMGEVVIDTHLASLRA